jgi:hypothetical protein
MAFPSYVSRVQYPCTPRSAALGSAPPGLVGIISNNEDMQIPFKSVSVMARREAKVLMALLDGHPTANISTPDWQRIEYHYARRLPQEIRHEIEHVTREFAFSALFERRAARVADARVEVEEIRDAAEQFRIILGRPSANVDGTHYARHLFRNLVRSDLLPSYHGFPSSDPIQVISELLCSCITACDAATNELDNPDFSVIEGKAWEQFVRTLTTILEKTNLPTGASNDKNKRISPFVNLVRELQECIPAESRQHTHSDLALAKAINGARKNTAGAMNSN